LELLPGVGSKFAKKWEVTFKKVTQKLWFFWRLELLNLDGKIDSNTINNIGLIYLHNDPEFGNLFIDASLSQLFKF